VDLLNNIDIKTPYDCSPLSGEQNFTYNGDKKNNESNDKIRQIRLLIPSSYVGGSNMGEFIDICMQRIQSDQIKICADNIIYNITAHDKNKLYEYLDYIEPPQCKNLIISIARINKIGGEEEVNNKIITLSKELNLKYYKITSKKDKEDIIKYRLQGFICYEGKSNGGHYVYYKSLSPDTNNNDWVKLNDVDREKNGTIVNQSTLPNNTGVLYYYTRVEESQEQDQNIVALPAQQQDDKVAAQQQDDKVAAGHVEPVEVANATESSFKYSFDIRSGLTPVYNKTEEPYYKEGKNQATFMASLNAGHENLRVEGGGTINGAFNRAITIDETIKKSTDSDDEDLGKEFIEMHISCYMNYYDIKNSSNLFECPSIKQPYNEKNVKAAISPILQEINNKYNATNNAGKFYHFEMLKELKNNTYISAMYLYISEQRLDNFQFKKGTLLFPGDVFIDILKSPPYAYGPNKAMIYCTGPSANNYKSDEEAFCKAVEIVGKNIANAIYHYNNNKKDTESIDYVRICLISGGSFGGSYDKVKIAEALINGIHSVNTTETVKDIVYNFSDKNLKTAFDNLKIQDNTLASAELTIPK
jgi:hypothetical protein